MIPLQMNNRNKLVVGVAAIILIIAGVWLLAFRRDGSMDKAAEAPLSKIPAVPTEFSRLSFFEGTDEMVSIAVPGAWEGFFRVRKSGDCGELSFIKDPAKPMSFFRLCRFAPGAEGAGEGILTSKKHEYRLETPIPAGEIDPDLAMMLSHLQQVKDSIKVQ